MLITSISAHFRLDLLTLFADKEFALKSSWLIHQLAISTKYSSLYLNPCVRLCLTSWFWEQNIVILGTGKKGVRVANNLLCIKTETLHEGSKREAWRLLVKNQNKGTFKAFRDVLFFPCICFYPPTSLSLIEHL